MATNKVVFGFVSVAVLYAVCSSLIEQCWQNSLNSICNKMTEHYFVDDIAKLAKKNVEEKLVDAKHVDISTVKTMVNHIVNNKSLSHYKTLLGDDVVKSYGDIIKIIVKGSSTLLYTPLYANYMIFQGRLTMLLITGVTRFLSRRLSWLSFSSLVPFGMLILSVLYFGLLMFGGKSAMILGYSILPVVVIIGTVTVLFTKITKVSIIDYANGSAITHYPLHHPNLDHHIDENITTQKDIKSAEATLSRQGKTMTSILFYAIANMFSLSYLDFRVAFILLGFTGFATFFWLRGIKTIDSDIKLMEEKSASNEQHKSNNEQN
jgi:ATP/ADP translocase